MRIFLKISAMAGGQTPNFDHNRLFYLTSLAPKWHSLLVFQLENIIFLYAYGVVGGKTNKQCGIYIVL